MAKSDEQFKLKAVRRYLPSGLGSKTVATAFGLDYGTLRYWTASYQMHGREGLAKKFSHYNAAFKREVIERIARENLSDRQAALYDIRNRSSISA